ncbi:MAG: hypothetical protein QXY92_08620 [Archaeoglobaceae archaeon]
MTLFEYKPVEYEIGKSDDIEGDRLMLTEKTIEQLEKINEKNKFLEIGRKRIKPLNYVGVVKAGKITLEIFPKFASEDRKEMIAGNLLKMLEFTLLDFREVDYAELSEINDFFEILIEIFARNLLNLLKTKQNFQYVRRYDEMRYVRGKIDFKKHCNPARLHLVPCEFYERHLDNLINRTLKYTCFLMSKVVETRETYRKLRRITDILEPVALAPVSVQQIESITFNRLNIEFKPFIEFCRVFLEHSSLTLQASKVESFSILIPMERLFEQFVAGVIRKERLYEVFGENAKLEIQKSKGAFLQKNGHIIAQMKPDIVIEIGTEKIIIDTKYKLLDPEARKLGIDQQDLYQIYAYCRELGANKALLIYPEGLNPISEEILEKPFLVGKDGNIKLFVKTLPLQDDLIEKWEDFVSKLEEMLKCLLNNKKFNL